MPRIATIAPGGHLYHVLDRGVGRMRLFDTDGDHDAFIRCMTEALDACPGVRLLRFCVMPNHWHLVLWPTRDGELANFMLRLTITHAPRWLEYRNLGGTGHLYHGRYKSFISEGDGHLLETLRHVERNPLRANFVAQAQDWRWSSLHIPDLSSDLAKLPLTARPLPKPLDWVDRVNLPETAAEFEAIRRSVISGKPFGSNPWIRNVAESIKWKDPRPRGRPRVHKSKSKKR